MAGSTKGVDMFKTGKDYGVQKRLTNVSFVLPVSKL